MKYKVCILAAGSGNRLRNYSKIHKGLLPINQKTIISKIINKFKINIEIIIAVGHNYQQVVEYINATHLRRKIKFVKVKKYSGKGSGPGYSLKLCKKYLQCPFIFSSCDTLIKNKIPPPTTNWIGISKVSESKNFLIVQKSNNEVKKFFDKKNKKYLKKKLKIKNKKYEAFIGLAGIKNYKTFWQSLDKNKKLINKEYQVSNGLTGLLNNKLSTKKFKWFDTGNLQDYFKAKLFFEKRPSLAKEGQFFYREAGLVIKYFDDKTSLNNRIYRSRFLKNTPKIYKNNHNFLIYKYKKGKLLSEINNLRVFKNFLKFMYKKFWFKEKSFRFEKTRLNLYCNKFYKIKTETRVNKFFNIYKEQDKIQYINNLRIPRLKKLLSLIKWSELNDAVPVLFHGDLQPENVIIDKNFFYLIDWRESFYKNRIIGDIYYELAKLHHALILSNKVIRENKYFVKVSKKKKIKYYFQKRKNLLLFKKELENFILSKKLSLKKVEFLSALIYLNIAPLHHSPYSKLLFYHGKFTLFQLLLKYKLI